jgi:hypothetical protein
LEIGSERYSLVAGRFFVRPHPLFRKSLEYGSKRRTLQIHFSADESLTESRKSHAENPKKPMLPSP